ncbi:MAG: hypothetical protein M3203_07265 [Actinomycetota bacterium]|nr:hypothetical protein [Actinomycetota bacterium]
MGRAKRMGAETPDRGLAIEYVRTRKVVRLLGWLDGESIEPVEFPVDELCERLGIDRRDLVPPQRFLLFAGSHRRRGGGRRDLVATFDSEEKAWAAFRELRQGHPALHGWAELASIDSLGQVNQLAWFGLNPAETPDPEDEARVRRRRTIRLLAAPDEEPTYLRAVTPS